MALLRNGSYLRLTPARFTGGSVHNNVGFRTYAPERRNIFAGEGGIDDTAAIPNGHLAPSAWLLPLKPGGMSYYYVSDITVTGTATLLAGYPIEGGANISIAVPDATAQLVAFGVGTSTIELQAGGTLAGSINGSGASAISVSGNNSLLGAMASGIGSAAIALTASGSILPEDDASPLRTGSATFVFSGSLVPYAIGHMTGAAVPYTELSPQSLASAVWQSKGADYTETGTMGAKLNTASSGGVDLESLANAVWNHEDAKQMATRLAEAWGRLGLDPSAPLVTGQTEITFGDIVMAMTGNATETTVTRQ